MLRACIGNPPQRCPTGALIAKGRRCSTCTRAFNQARGTSTQRGYGTVHQRARTTLASLLPAPCGYCGKTLEPGEPWVAAHVVDGDASAGWMHAHPLCNERAKRRA